MKDFRRDYPDRMWIEVFEVRLLQKVQAFATGQPNCYWVPEAGISGWLGRHFFKTFLEAKHRRIENLTEEIHILQRLLVSAEQAKEGA